MTGSDAAGVKIRGAPHMFGLGLATPLSLEGLVSISLYIYIYSTIRLTQSYL
jgi:hypothetical protein